MGHRRTFINSWIIEADCLQGSSSLNVVSRRIKVFKYIKWVFGGINYHWCGYGYIGGGTDTTVDLA